MRLVIAAQPKAGNSWLKCLLATVYDLKWLDAESTPRGASLEAFVSWAAAGSFPDDSVFHRHYEYSPEALAAFSTAGAQVVSILRNPYDAFVSTYFWVNAQANNERRAARPRGQGRARPPNAMIGKPLDHPDVLEYLARRFRSSLEKAEGWLKAGVPMVRYEALHESPVAELTGLADRLRPVEPARIEQALLSCEANTVRRERPGMSRRLRSATAGDWRNHLDERHLAIFREQYAELIERLGYQVL